MRESHTSIHHPQVYMSTSAILFRHHPEEPVRYARAIPGQIEHRSRTTISRGYEEMGFFLRRQAGCGKNIQFEEERYETTTGRPHYINTNDNDAMFRWKNTIGYAKRVPRSQVAWQRYFRADPNASCHTCMHELKVKRFMCKTCTPIVCCGCKRRWAGTGVQRVKSRTKSNK